MGSPFKKKGHKIPEKGVRSHKEGSEPEETSGLAKQRSFSYQIALFIVTDISKHEGFMFRAIFSCQPKLLNVVSLH